MTAMDEIMAELLRAERAAAAVDDWGVYVNEASIYATGQGVAWWLDFRSTEEFKNRLTRLTDAAVHVARDNEYASEFLASLLVEEGGIPQRAVKVKRLSQCAHLRSA